MPYCSKCGAKHQDKARFCSRCGNEIKAATAMDENAERLQSRVTSRKKNQKLNKASTPIAKDKACYLLMIVAFISAFLPWVKWAPLSSESLESFLRQSNTSISARALGEYLPQESSLVSYVGDLLRAQQVKEKAKSNPLEYSMGSGYVEKEMATVIATYEGKSPIGLSVVFMLLAFVFVVVHTVVVKVLNKPSYSMFRAALTVLLSFLVPLILPHDGTPAIGAYVALLCCVPVLFMSYPRTAQDEL